MTPLRSEIGSPAHDMAGEDARVCLNVLNYLACNGPNMDQLFIISVTYVSWELLAVCIDYTHSQEMISLDCNRS